MIFFLVLALVGFVASAVVHASTFLHAPPLGMNQTWPLHLGIFIVFIPAFLTERRRDRTAAATDGKDVPKPARGGGYSHAPRWASALLAVVFGYAIFNFFLGLVLIVASSQGKIVERDGRHVMVQGREYVRDVGDAEYRVYQGRIARMFSGHWMMFYWMSAVGIAEARRRTRAAAAARRNGGPPDAAAGGGYTLHPSPRLAVETHATLMVLLPVVVALACAAAGIWLDVRSGAGRGTGAGDSTWNVGAVLLILASLPALCATAGWISRFVGARCPSCGGRSMTKARWWPGGRANDTFTYTCLDCGQASRPDGSKA